MQRREHRRAGGCRWKPLSLWSLHPPGAEVAGASAVQALSAGLRAFSFCGALHQPGNPVGKLLRVKVPVLG
jgi:hypothetical protein